MADSYRYRCGECGHRTAWGSESRGEQAIETHYGRSHPHVVPGGWSSSERVPLPAAAAVASSPWGSWSCS